MVGRPARSLAAHLVGFLNELNAVGCDLYLEKQAVDTTTPAGRALFQMLGVFAEFERAILQERIHAGIARARRNGTKSGKAIGHPRVSAKLEATIRAFSAVGRRHSQDGKGVRCRGWHGAAGQARDAGWFEIPRPRLGRMKRLSLTAAARTCPPVCPVADF